MPAMAIAVAETMIQKRKILERADMSVLLPGEATNIETLAE